MLAIEPLNREDSIRKPTTQNQSKQKSVNRESGWKIVYLCSLNQATKNHWKGKI